MKKEVPIIVLIILIVLLLLALSFTSFYTNPTQKKSANVLPAAKNIQNDKSSIKIGEKIVNVTLALDDATRAQGLSGHAPLKEDEGMLFVFDNPGYYGFWMKDMLFPIDIIWISEEGKVIHIEKSLSPDTYPTSFTSDTPAKYVLEVQAGFSDTNHITIGTKFDLL